MQPNCVTVVKMVVVAIEKLLQVFTGAVVREGKLPERGCSVLEKGDVPAPMGVTVPVPVPTTPVGEVTELVGGRPPVRGSQLSLNGKPPETEPVGTRNPDETAEDMKPDEAPIPAGTEPGGRSPVRGSPLLLNGTPPDEEAVGTGKPDENSEDEKPDEKPDGAPVPDADKDELWSIPDLGAPVSLKPGYVTDNVVAKTDVGNGAEAMMFSVDERTTVPDRGAPLLLKGRYPLGEPCQPEWLLHPEGGLQPGGGPQPVGTADKKVVSAVPDRIGAVPDRRELPTRGRLLPLNGDSTIEDGIAPEAAVPARPDDPPRAPDTKNPEL